MFLEKISVDIQSDKHYFWIEKKERKGKEKKEHRQFTFVCLWQGVSP